MTKVAFIGGGSATAELMGELLEARHARGVTAAASVVIFDPAETIGRGIAWNTGSKILAANMPVETLSPDPNKPALLQQEMGFKTKGHARQAYMSRERVGGVLVGRFEKARERASKEKVEVRHERSLVHSVRRSGESWELTFGEGQQETFDQVVLAVGNVLVDHRDNLDHAPGFFADPCDFARLAEDIDPSNSVLIMGTGPTAVDVFNVLSDGRSGPVTMASRNGKLTWVRPLYDSKRPLKFATLERLSSLITADRPTLSARDVQLLIEGEFASEGVSPKDIALFRQQAASPPEVSLHLGLAQAQTKQGWFSVLKSIDNITPDLWNMADEALRKVLWNDVRPEHARVSFAMPDVNAKRLQRALRGGRLFIEGGLKAVRYDAAHDRFVATFVQGQNTFERAFKYVVAAKGLSAKLENFKSPLIRQMKEEGLLTPHAYAGAKVDFITGQALDADGHRVPSLYVLAGPLTQGTHGFVNALLEVAKSAARTAEAMVDDQLGTRPRSPAPTMTLIDNSAVLPIRTANTPSSQDRRPAA